MVYTFVWLEAKILTSYNLKASVLASPGFNTKSLASALSWRPNVWPQPRNIGLCLDLLASALRPKFWTRLALRLRGQRFTSSQRPASVAAASWCQGLPVSRNTLVRPWDQPSPPRMVSGSPTMTDLIYYASAWNRGRQQLWHRKTKLNQIWQKQARVLN